MGPCWILVAALLVAGEAKPAAASAPAAPVPLELETSVGKLYGFVDLPNGKGPFPVVVLIAGSGPTDHDGNQPRLKIDNLKMLGQALAQRGIAVLRYDRRGIGKSAKTAPKEADLR